MSALLLAIIVSLVPLAMVEGQDLKSYSPAVGRDFPTNVYFGDTHLHTRTSLDAFGDGNTRIGPDEAYRFAKGETIIGDDGMANRISRPHTGYFTVKDGRL